MSRARAKGTAWESAIVEFLRQRGWPYAERRALAGNNDRGDIAGVASVMIEAKSCAKLDLAGWIAEANVQQANDRADVGVVWVKRRGKTSPGSGYVVMTGENFVDLLNAAGYGAPIPSVDGAA